MVLIIFSLTFHYTFLSQGLACHLSVLPLAHCVIELLILPTSAGITGVHNAQDGSQGFVSVRETLLTEPHPRPLNYEKRCKDSELRGFRRGHLCGRFLPIHLCSTDSRASPVLSSFSTSELQGIPAPLVFQNHRPQRKL